MRADDPSESPNPAAANPYASPRPVAPPPDHRGPPPVPWTARLVGWLHLIVSLPGLWMTCELCRWTVYGILASKAAMFGETAEVRVLFHVVSLGTMIVRATAWIVLELLLIGSGVELLRGRVRGRRLSVWWAWLRLADHVLTLLAGFVFAWWWMQVGRGAIITGMPHLRLVDLLPMAYPVFVLFVMYFSSLGKKLDEREAFLRGGGTPPGPR